MQRPSTRRYCHLAALPCDLHTYAYLCAGVLGPYAHALSIGYGKLLTADLPQVLDACLKEISRGLLEADVNVKLVMNLQNNVKKRANNADKGAGLNKRKIIEKAVVDELCSMLSTSAQDKEQEKKLVDLKKGAPNVVMFVGLQVNPPWPRACMHTFPLLRACMPSCPLAWHRMRMCMTGSSCWLSW